MVNVLVVLGGALAASLAYTTIRKLKTDPRQLKVDHMILVLYFAFVCVRPGRCNRYVSRRWAVAARDGCVYQPDSVGNNHTRVWDAGFCRADVAQQQLSDGISGAGSDNAVC